jgi:serine/threonine protein kinase
MSSNCGYDLSLNSCIDGLEGEYNEYCRINEKGNCSKIPGKTLKQIQSEIIEKNPNALAEQKDRMSKKVSIQSRVSEKPQQTKIILEKPIAVPEKPKEVIVEKPVAVPEKSREIIVEKPTAVPEKPREIVQYVQDRSLQLKTIPKEQIKTFILEDDFILLGSTGSSGSYGATIKAKIKSSNEPVILKRYTGYQADRLLSLDNIREIVILQHLNKFPDTKCVKFYGTAFNKNKNNFYLVLEPLELDLHKISVNRVDDKSRDKGRLSPEQYKIIFYQILKAFNAIHSLGIVHNDIKLPNLMIKGTDIRIIDFGLSEFLGFGPSNEVISRYICTEITKAPDDEDQLEYGYIAGNRKTFVSDLYSIGATIVHLVTREYSKLIVKGNKIISLYPHDNEDMSEYLKQDHVLGKEGFDLLLKIMNPEARLRLSAKEALQHPYFNGLVDPTIDRTLVGGVIKTHVTGIINDITDFISKVFTNKYVKYTDDDIVNKRYELIYVEEIHQNYMDNIIPVNSRIETVNRYFQLVDFLINTYGTEQHENINYVFAHLDVFVNTILQIKPKINTILTDNIIRDSMVITYFNEAISMSIDLLYYKSLRYFEERITNDDAAKYMIEDIIIKNNSNFDFYPVWIHSFYIYYRLRSSINDDKIKPMLDTILTGSALTMLLWIISPLVFTDNITFWDVAVFGAIRTINNRDKSLSIEMLTSEPIIPCLSMTQTRYNSMNTFFQDTLNMIRRLPNSGIVSIKNIFLDPMF